MQSVKMLRLITFDRVDLNAFEDNDDIYETTLHHYEGETLLYWFQVLVNKRTRMVAVSLKICHLNNAEDNEDSETQDDYLFADEFENFVEQCIESIEEHSDGFVFEGDDWELDLTYEEVLEIIHNAAYIANIYRQLETLHLIQLCQQAIAEYLHAMMLFVYVYNTLSNSNTNESPCKKRKFE